MTPAEDAQAARERRWVLYGVILFWMTVLSIIFPPAPRLVWNASASAPMGLYWVRPGVMAERGDMVVARLPDRVRQLAAERHYLPSNVPLVKRVAAVPGDRVCAAARAITINEKAVATRADSDSRGRAMPVWQGCRTLTAGEYFLLMADVPASFDGRYFGMTTKAEIIGEARLIWSR